MAKIQLMSGGSSLLPEGVVTLKITEVEHDTDFGTLDIHCETKSGMKHKERFFLMNQDNEVNEGATRAFSYLAKTAMQDMDMEEIDPDELIGTYFTATVTHVEAKTLKDDGTPFVNARIGNYQPADNFGDDSNAVVDSIDVEDDDDDLDLSFLED